MEGAALSMRSTPSTVRMALAAVVVAVGFSALLLTAAPARPASAVQHLATSPLARPVPATAVSRAGAPTPRRPRSASASPLAAAAAAAAAAAGAVAGPALPTGTAVGSAPRVAATAVAAISFVVAAITVTFTRGRRQHHAPSIDIALAATTGPVPRRAALAGAVAAAGLSGYAAAPAQAVPLWKVADGLQRVLERRAAGGALDIPVADVLRLVLHDAVTFNPDTRVGGCNGSIRFPEELQRPENASLAPLVATLQEIQVEVAQLAGAAPSFADTMAFAGNFVLAREFKRVLCAKTDPESCDVLYNGYGNKPPTVRLGRLDASGPEVAGRVPWTGATAAEFRAASERVGLSPRELCALAPALLVEEGAAEAVLAQDPECQQNLKDLARSKGTTTRTTFEVSVFKAYTRLVSLARFDDKQYA